MPIIGIIVGGIMTGLIYWLMYGNGLEYIDQSLRDRRNTRKRLENQASSRAAPLKAIRHPAEAAGVLMQLVALARGTPTPDQDAAVEAQMRRILEPGDDLGTRLIAIRHTAAQVRDPNEAVSHLIPLLREKLDAGERDELEGMLEAVAVVHGGPIPAQERLIARTMRLLAETV